MKSFILPTGHKSLISFLQELPEGKKWEVSVKEYNEVRTVSQNSRYWAILTEIAEQVPDETGIFYSPETWHSYFKTKFIGKDTFVVDGELSILPKTSTKLNVREFGDYMTQVEAWAADHDVMFRFVDNWQTGESTK